MPTKTLDVSALGDINPYVVTTGYSYNSGSMRVISGALGLATGTDAIIRDQTAMSGSAVESTIKISSISGDSRGCGVLDASGNGYVFLINSTNKRLFSVASNAVLTGSVLLTIASSPANGDDCTMVYNTATGLVSFKRNGVAEGGTYAGTAYATVYSCGFSRASAGRFSTLVSNFASAQSIDTITSPIVPEATVSGNHTGFATGAGTISTPNPSGTTVSNITFAASTYSGTYATPVHLSAFPLFGTSYTHTFTIGAQTATIVEVVNQPAGFDLIPVTTPVLDDLTYITANFDVVPVTGDIMLAESGKLTTADGTGYWTAPAGEPVVAQVVHQIASTGVTWIYEFTFTEAGVVSSPVMPDDATVTMSTADTTVGQYEALSGSAPITYSLTGADASDFTVDEDTAEVEPVMPSAVGSYAINVVATNSEGSDSTALTINIVAAAVNPLHFGSSTGHDPSTADVSSPVRTVSGLIDGETAAVTIDTGEYRKNGGSWVSTAGTVENGDTIQVRADSDPYWGRRVTVTLSTDDVDHEFVIVNRRDPELPASDTAGSYRATMTPIRMVGI